MIQSGTTASSGRGGAAAPAAAGPATGLGVYLRRLRQTRGLTLERAAQAAGIGRVTLNRWETGAHQPRLPELQALLHALKADANERHQALVLVDAPRARERVRQAAEHLGERAGLCPPPGAGDLLRALRRRRRMSAEPVASALGVTTRTLRRWEQGEVAVPAERLDDLCRVLGAAPQERAALERQRLWLGAPQSAVGASAGPSSLEALEQQCDGYLEQMDRGQLGLLDLHFLVLEARLWPRAAAAREKPAQRLLARVYSSHAAFLEQNSREPQEVRVYAERALDLVVGHLCWEPWWHMPVHSVVWAAPAKRDVAGSRRRIALARGWLDLSTDTGWQSAQYRDMAEYATAAGDTAAALDWAGRAHTLAQDQDDPRVLHLAGHVWGRALFAAGRPGEALALLPSDAHATPHQQLWDSCYRVEARLALGDGSGAQAELGHAFALCREHDLPTGLPGELAQRL